MMRLLIVICSVCVLAGCAMTPPSVSHGQMETLQGIVLEKRCNVKSYEAWNAPSDPYYVLDLGDVTETYKSGDKTWEESRKRHITLRPSQEVPTTDLQALKGRRVSLRGYHVAGKTYQPSGNEAFPMEPEIETAPDDNIEVTGWRPAKQGSGFAVTEIMKTEDTEP